MTNELEPAAKKSTSRTVLHLFILIVLLALFCYAFVVNAWVVDDAYITFRVIDNLISGHGLTWNPGERVQAFTHPLWALLLCSVVAVTREFFFTSLAVSFVLCVVLLIVAIRHFRLTGWWKPPLFIALLLTSKTVMDYTSSGLETPLSYCLAILFFAGFLRELKKEAKPETPQQHDGSFSLLLIAALATVNRYDNLLLYLPALLYLTYQTPRGGRLRFCRRAFLAFSPLIAWVLFALFYYGTPLPNTAYAKMLNSGLTSAERAERGWGYLSNAVAWDVLGFSAAGLTLLLALIKRDVRALLAMAGVLLCVIYVVTGGAAATHMNGRFLALPLLVGLFVFIRYFNRPIVGLACAGVLLYSQYHNPTAPLKFGSSWYKAAPQEISWLDANWFVHEEGAGLVYFLPRKIVPDHVWLREGYKFRASPDYVHIGGPLDSAAIGYFGYAAGPDKYIIDKVALSDPLLARLPACQTDRWVSGHFHRILPDGYLESVENNDNRIVHPALHAYYDHLRRITRGPLFNLKRSRDIVLFNLGCFDSLLDEYVASPEFLEKNVELKSILKLPTNPVYPVYLPNDARQQ